MSSFSDAISARYSCRTFDGCPLVGSERRRIEELLHEPGDLPFGSRIRFALLDDGRAATAGASRLGTYGVVRGAPCFVAGAVREGPNAREDYGFALERIVLLLTGMGLGTCWLAGTWRPSGFAERLALRADEIIPAVTPVGRPAARPAPIDALFRIGAGSSRRLPWERLFSVSPAEAGPWAPCLEAVRRAPSATNGQPWRIAKEPLAPVFHLGVVGPAPQPSARRLDAGIAMCHFALIAAERGLAGAWTPPEASGGGQHPLLPPGTVHVASWIPA